MRTPCDERTKCLVRQICDQSQHSSKTFRSEARCSKHCTVKENASDKISDYLTEIIIRHVAAELGFQNHRVCLQVLPSLLTLCSLVCSHPTFPTAKTSKPSFFDFSWLQNTTETLATLASCFQIISNPYLYQQHPAQCSSQE